MPQYDDVPIDMPQNLRPPEAPKAGHSKLVLWGGIGLAAGASLLAARALANALAGDAEDRPMPKAGRRESLAPRFAEMEEDDRRALRARARAEVLDFEERAADIREAALRERREKERAARARHRKKARRSRVGDVSMSAVKLATNITSLIAAANAVTSSTYVTEDGGERRREWMFNFVKSVTQASQQQAKTRFVRQFRQRLTWLPTP